MTFVVILSVAKNPLTYELITAVRIRIKVRIYYLRKGILRYAQDDSRRTKLHLWELKICVMINY